MEKIIKDIIDADREARERVQNMNSECYQLSSVLEEQRHKISKQYEAVSSQKKAEHKAELEAQLTAHQKEADQEYETIAAALDEQFEKHKDTWINEIYLHCLGKS